MTNHIHPPLQQESLHDYAAHEATYNGFIAGTKYAIIGIAILVVGLYFSIIAGQMGVGLVLVLASLVVPVAMAMMARR